MDGARDGVFILTDEGVILDANRRAAEFCAQAGTSLIGSRLDRSLRCSAGAQGAPFSVDTDAIVELCAIKNRTKIGRCFEASSAAVTVDRERYRLVIVRDVTEQRRLEAGLRRVQKARRAGSD